MASGSDLRKGGEGQEEGGKEDGRAGRRALRKAAWRGRTLPSPLEGPTFLVSSRGQAPAHLYLTALLGSYFWGYRW